MCAGAASGHRVGLAVELELGGGTLALGASARDVRLRRLQVLRRRNAGVEELLHARQVLLRERIVSFGLARFGLRDAEFGRRDHRQRLAGLHAVAGPHGDRVDASAERREDAHRAILVPHEAPVEAHHHVASRLDRHRGDGADLRTARREDDDAVLLYGELRPRLFLGRVARA